MKKSKNIKKKSLKNLSIRKKSSTFAKEIIKHQIMLQNKNYCIIHHFYYNGNKCPFCEKEKYENIAKKTSNNNIKVNKEITEEDVQKLINKFNMKNDKKKTR